MPGKPNVVFVLGGPGAGKGTECGKLVEEFGFVHLSAGDLLREERKNGGQQGELINDYIKEGKIIPVAITIGLIKTAMEKAGTEGKDKFLIDGFPRNADNLSGWNEIMDEVCEVHFCLYMECTEEIMQQRILGRNEGRADDNAEAIKKRFKTYVESTMPIIKIFEQRGLLRTVDSTGTPEEVHAVCQQLFAQFQPLVLTYFDGPGRGELARLALSAGNVEYKDNRVAFAEWPAIKSNPESVVNKCFGQMPVVSHGCVAIGQSLAVASYCADFGLHKGRYLSPIQRAQITMFLGAHADIQASLYKCHFGSSESKAEGLKNLPTAVAPVLAGLEKNVPDTGFLCGGNVPSLADLAVFDNYTSPFPGLNAEGTKVDLAPYPKLAKLVERVGEFPSIKAYVAKRGF